jgi:hypothetical protein
MTPGTVRRRAAALVAALLLLGAGSAAAAPRLLPRTADRADRVTFGIGPGGQAYADRRAFVTYAAPPGGQLLDRVAIYNQSNHPLDLLVYASDASNARDGALGLKPRAARNTESGAWVLLGDAAERGQLAVDARSTVRVHVPPQSRAKGIGRVVLPMRVVVPTDATPGDHVAGVVAALVSRGENPQSQNIELEQRVALRVYVNVSGEVRPRLAVKILKADYVGGSGLGLKGTTRVTYQVRNVGNVRLGALPEVTVKAPLGLGSWKASGKGLDELLPGGSAIQTTDVEGTPPTVIQHATVRVVAKAAPGSRLAKVPAASDTVRLWAITWQEVVLLVLVLLTFLYRRFRKARRRGRHAASPGPREKATVAAGAVALLALTVLLVAGGGRAQASDLGPVQVSPQSGSDATLLFGYVADARCPRTTADSYWTVDGPDLPRDTAILAPGNTTGTGPQQFRGASIANLKTINSGAFSRSGTYTIRFSCVRAPDGKVSDSYEATLRYHAGGKGSFQVVGARPVPAYVLDPTASRPPTAAATPSKAPAPRAGGPAGSSVPSDRPTAAPTPASSGLASQGGRGTGEEGALGWWLVLAGLVPVALGGWYLRRGRADGAGEV